MASSAQNAIRLGSGEMFDRIALRYDLLNRLMTFGMDKRWRRKTVDALQLKPNQRVLDVATGTADLALLIAQRHRTVRVDGIDPSQGMLQIGQQKVDKRGVAERVFLHAGDAQALSFANASFDAVTIAFGIRNVPDRARALKEMARVTKPGGRLAVLEAMEPRRGLFSRLAQFYVHHVLPLIGGALSNSQEYRYLEQSMHAFPSSQEFIEQLNQSGWRFIEQRSFAFGACQLFVAEAR